MKVWKCFARRCCLPCLRVYKSIPVRMCVVMPSDGYSLCSWVYKSIPARVCVVLLSGVCSLCSWVYKSIPAKV